MLTRRENILIRPWQDRRYINHRNKVEHALPAIDVKPPVKRAHVTCKLKKLQKESERCARIEQDNFTLLQHLRSIMHSSRIDNVWQEAPPNFLHRVGIYCKANGEMGEFKALEYFDPPTNRKERCLGCSPHRIEKKDKIPEERIPWDPPRPRLSRRQSGSLGINNKSNKKEIVQCTTKIQDLQSKKSSDSAHSSTPSKTSKSRRRARSAMPAIKLNSKQPNNISNRKMLPNIETQSIVLSHGALNLAINFPLHASVVLKDGNKEKLLQSEYCHCKSIKKPNSSDVSNDVVNSVPITV